MPPIPSKLAEDASDLIASLERRARFVEEDILPRLLACGSPPSSANPSPGGPKDQQRLAEEAREELGVLSRDLDNLSITVDDQSGERARSELRDVVERWSDRLHELRAKTRTAILTSKRAVDAQKLNTNRAELFARAPSSSEKPSDPASQNLESASQNLTTSLHRLMASMQAELQTSVLSTQLLTTSTTTLSAASAQHDSLTAAMDTAKEILGALEKADWMDRLVLIGAFMFFICVVVWVGWARTIGRGVRVVFSILSWVPGLGSGSSKAVEFVPASAVASATASVVSIAVSAASVASSLAGSLSQKGANAVEEPEPTPTPVAVVQIDENGGNLEDAAISEILSSVLPPEPTPEPTPSAIRTALDHVEL
ncbi:hypothetical protein D9611_007059 [Ephemerocybe angulata]|uniref:Sec20 C-terminal domain-containing protein n=1 Tax=Ephemerocybe angulata TaxID=980116 RepID=A0A8H5B100_9AGAR|nr:hypothetical protein D9611_007059 [Tulosesus angulatus]